MTSICSSFRNDIDAEVALNNPLRGVASAGISNRSRGDQERAFSSAVSATCRRWYSLTVSRIWMSRTFAV